jgi:hypothetical protein
MQPPVTRRLLFSAQFQSLFVEGRKAPESPYSSSQR